jgi:hypothetical protein
MYHALIRTHHITSRKKVATLKAAAKKYDCFALLRSGGMPGIMYVRGDEESVREWVRIVHVSTLLVVFGRSGGIQGGDGARSSRIVALRLFEAAFLWGCSSYLHDLPLLADRKEVV